MAFFNPFTGFVYDPEQQAAQNDLARFQTQMQSAVSRDQINAQNRQNQQNNSTRMSDISARERESMSREGGLDRRSATDAELKRESNRAIETIGKAQMENDLQIAQEEAKRYQSGVQERPLDALRREQEIQKLVELATEEDTRDNQLANAAQRIDYLNTAIDDFQNSKKLVDSTKFWTPNSPEQKAAKARISDLEKTGFNPTALEAERKSLISQIASLGARVDSSSNKILSGIPRVTPKEWRNVFGKVAQQPQSKGYGALPPELEAVTPGLMQEQPQQQPYIPRAWGATPGFNGNIGLPTMGSGMLNGPAATGLKFKAGPDGRLIPVQ